MVATGLSIELPPGYEAQIRPRSGLAAKHAITVPNSPATIDPGYRGEIRVIPVPIVVIDQRRNRLKRIGMAIGAKTLLMLSAPDIVEVPLKISQDHEIQQAVIVEVHPRRAGRPAAASDAGLRRHVGEGAVPIVVIEPVAAVRGDV